MKKKVLIGVAAVAGFLGIWNLALFLYSRFISHSPFTFSFTFNILEPLVIGLLAYIFLISIGKEGKK